MNGSPSTTSKTPALAAESVQGALDALLAADVIVLVTPVYRATYSGLLKLVLDQLPTDALAGKAVVLAATAGSGAHYLALDTGLRAVVASLSGWTVPTVAYATGDDFDADGSPGERILDALRRGVDEARTVVDR